MISFWKIPGSITLPMIHHNSNFFWRKQPTGQSRHDKAMTTLASTQSSIIILIINGAANKMITLYCTHNVECLPTPATPLFEKCGNAQH
jgi:hypothetical protein